MTRARELADLLTGGQTISTADNTAQLTLESTDADASVGPLLDMIRDSASPADSDTLGRIRFRGDNDAGEAFTYGTITSKITDASDSTEGGLLTFLVGRNGSVTSALDLNETETVFNEGGLDADFRVESDNNANMLFVDASADAVGVGTNSPTLDSSLAGLSVSSDSTLLHINDSDGACLKLSDPASGSNRGLGIALQGTSAVISNCESGELRFGTGNTERMRISSAGAIGINESSPSTFLHIDNGGANGSGQADAIRVHNPGTTAGDGAGIKFSAGSSTTGAAIFGIGQALNSCNLVFRAGGDTERMRVAHTGQVMVGDSTGGSYSDGGLFTRHAGGANNSPFCVVNGTTSGTRRMVDFFVGTGTSRVGSIQSNDSATAFNTSSDYRLKENVADMTGAIDRVKALAPKRFNFIVSPDTTVDGFLAHEVSSIVPEAISGEKDEVATWGKEEKLPDGVKVGDNKLDDDGNTIPIMQGIDHSKLVPLLTGALREAIAKIETLETKVAALEAE
jgi:hypothetical protein